MVLFCPIVQVLMNVLNENELKNLPPVLYLQLDNCGRENKNKYLLGFCALLVTKNVFKKVPVILYSFLCVTIGLLLA